ncbi:MAG: quinone oxidoreductase [Actinobacteria bacterium]|nr:quinone oxidoreductase [Actinomycetota bacterium]
MRSITFNRCGDSSVLQMIESETLSPAANEALVKVALAGVNFIDVYHRRGQYPLPLPSGIGLEGIGEIVSIGKACDDFKVGDRVFWTSALGSYAQYVNVPIDQLTVLEPEIQLTNEQFLPLLLQGMTAHYLVNSSYPVTSEDTVLVTAAAGGVGQLVVQLLKNKGATVIACASNSNRAQYAKNLGADFVGTYDQIEALVNEATQGQGVEVVYDSVGKDYFDVCLSVIKDNGMYVLCGAASGPVPPLDLGRLNAKSLAVRRPMLASYTRTHADRLGRLNDLASFIEHGKLKYPEAKVFALADTQSAHDLIESRTYSGKIGLDPWT